ncbi:MAG TPA: hypothetical protein VF288_12805 [Mycobacteriales bacterium]
MALVLCLAAPVLGLASCGHRADATTVLRGAVGVTIVSPDGVPHPAVNGEHLHVGETVRTTTSDTALVTGRRVTTLGPATAVAIADRSHYLLDGGTVVLDQRKGPSARVDAGPVTVDHVGATAVRIERGFAVRVAVFDGGSAAVSASERTVTVPALHEIDVPGASLPAAPAPLALRDDVLDQVAAPALVAEDVALDQRAAALDRPGGTVVPAALVRSLPAAPAATAPSERILPVAIARADRTAPLTVAYADATELRSGGGSWAVVASLLDAKLAAVQRQLDDLLTTPPAGLTLPAGVTGNAGASAVAALLAAAAPGPSAAQTPGAGTGAGSPGPAGSPGGRPSAPVPAPTPTPTPTPAPLVQTLVSTVIGLLPHGGATTPTAPASPAPATPSPSPQPSAAGGLLGGVLGSLLGGG